MKTESGNQDQGRRERDKRAGEGRIGKAALCSVCLYGLAVVLLSGAQPAASITGVVRIASAVPAGILKVTTDQRTCGSEVPDESLVTSAEGGVAHAVVTVAGLKAPAAAPEPAITNRHCRFVPHVVLARPGSQLRIASADDTLHTTHAYEAERTLFNVAIPTPAITLTRPLDRAGIIRLGCDSHPWMRGYVVVTPDVAAVTSEGGRFSLQGIPPGRYELRVWHERLAGTTRKVTVSAGEAAEISITLAGPP